jgi:hypothetical protein
MLLALNWNDNNIAFKDNAIAPVAGIFIQSIYIYYNAGRIFASPPGFSFASG